MKVTFLSMLYMLIIIYENLFIMQKLVQEKSILIRVQ